MPSFASRDARMSPMAPMGAQLVSGSESLEPIRLPIQNMQSPSTASSSICRYRGSKMRRGIAPCGKRTESGSNMTPHFSGMVREDMVKGLDRRQCLFKVFEDVVDVFDSDGEANEFGGNSTSELLLSGELGVCGRCRMNREGFGVSNIGKV